MSVAGASPLTTGARAEHGTRVSLPFAYGCACALVAALIWGGGAVVSRHLVTQGHSPIDLTVLRYLGCAPIALAVLGRRGSRWLSAGLSWPRIAVLVALAGPPYHLLVIAGYGHATSGGGALLIAGLLPIFALGLACAARRCVPRLVHLVGIGAIMAGLGMLAGPGGNAPASGGLIGPAGLVLFAAAALSWAIFNHLVRTWQVEPLRLTLLLAATSPAFIPLYLVVRPDVPFDITFGDAALQMIYHGVLVGLVGTFVFLAAVAHAGARCAGNIQALSPAFAVGLGWMLLAESLPTTGIVAMMAIVVGILAASQPWVSARSSGGALWASLKPTPGS